MTNEQMEAQNKTMFYKYTRYITEKVMDKYGASYENMDTMGHYWRDNLPYSAETENFIVFETKIFIRLFVTTKNGWALRQFIDGISDYLSAYVKRAPDTGSRNRARKKLRNLLYNQSAHIQYIIAENKRTQEIAVAKKQARLEQSLKDRAAAAAKKQELENKTTKRPCVYIPKQEFENTRNALINQEIINLNTKSRQ